MFNVPAGAGVRTTASAVKMNLALAAVIGLSIAFLLRFLVALHKEVRWFSSRPVIVPHWRQERPPDRGRVVVMNPKGKLRTG